VITLTESLLTNVVLTNTARADVAQDSVTAAPPPAPARTGPPDTSYYMKLGYAVAGAIFLAYIVLLLRRVASVRKTS
jgi:hypothetical protein